MQAPLVFRAILGLLMDLAIPASLGAFVMAGMRLRSEGGMNFEASGGFLKWLLWGCFLLSLPGVSHWLVSESVPGAQQLAIAGAIGAPYTAGIERVTNDFVNDVLIGHIVPVVAASLVFKAVLDMSQGYNPLASIIAALFLLGVQGFYNLATGSWMQTGDAYGMTDMLMSMFGYPQQLEQQMLSANPNGIGTIGSAYQNVFSPLPPQTAVPQNIAYQIDMDDAQAQDALKKAIELDAFAAREMEVAQKLNQQIAASAPGTAPMLDAEASAWVLQANAYTQMGMAELLRVNSANLSNRGGALKDSTTQMRNLNQRLLQILTPH